MYPIKYFTAIFFLANKTAYKYHNIKNEPLKLKKFEDFARAKGGITLNYYDSKTGRFIPPQVRLVKAEKKQTRY